MDDFKRLANLVKSQINVDYNKKSVKLIEEFIENNRHNQTKEAIIGLTTSLGSFLGECIIHNFGGYWHEDINGRWCVQFDENNCVYPFSKVQKQFENGLEDSVDKFYAMIPILYPQDAQKNLFKIEYADHTAEHHAFHRYFSWVSKVSYPLRKLYWKKIRKVSTEKWRSSDKNAFYHCTSCGKFIGKEKHAVFDQLDRAHCSPACAEKSRWHWTWDYEKEGRDYDL